jgi:hypothetical protein
MKEDSRWNHGLVFKRLYVGIDPGETGACVGITEDLDVAICEDIQANIPWVWDFANRLKGYALDRECQMLITLEKPFFPKPRMLPIDYLCDACKHKNRVWRPQHNSPKSTAQQWMNFNTIETALHCAGLDVTVRAPNEWMKPVLKSVPKEDDSKGTMLKRVRELWNHEDFYQGPRGGVRQDRCDAACIALYYHPITRNSLF